MTVDIVEFEPSSPLKLDARSPEGEIKLAAKSILHEDLFVTVQLLPREKTQAAWLTYPDALRRFELKRGERFEIPVKVRLPAKTEVGTYSFAVLVASDRSPEVEFSTSPPLTVELKREDGINWWKIVAIATLAALLVGLSGYGIWVLVDHLRRPRQLGDPCDPDEPRCREGLVCSAAAKQCLSQEGGDCRTPADYENGGACTDGKCGRPLGQSGCDNDAECPPGQKCVAPRMICLLAPGEVCQSPKVCSAGRCNDRGRCARDDGGCDVPGDCPRGQECKDGRCVAEEESFTVILTVVGANRVEMIKAVREVTGVDLRTAKDLVDLAPSEIKSGVSREEAERIFRRIAEAGGRAELRPSPPQ